MAAMNEPIPLQRRTQSLQIPKHVTCDMAECEAIDSNSIKAAITNKKHESNEVSVNEDSLGLYLERKFLKSAQDFSFECNQFVIAFQLSENAKSFSLCSPIFECLASDLSVMRKALEWNNLNHRQHGLVGFVISLHPMCSESKLLEVTLCYSQAMINGKLPMQAQLCTIVSCFVRLAHSVKKQLNDAGSNHSLGDCIKETEVHTLRTKSAKQSTSTKFTKKKAHSSGPTPPDEILSLRKSSKVSKSLMLKDSPQLEEKEFTIDKFLSIHPELFETRSRRAIKTKSLIPNDQHSSSILGILPPSNLQGPERLDSIIEGRQLLQSNNHRLSLHPHSLCLQPLKRQGSIIVNRPYIRGREKFVASKMPSLPPPPRTIEDADKTPTISNMKKDLPPKGMVKKAIKRLTTTKRLSIVQTSKDRPLMGMGRRKQVIDKNHHAATKPKKNFPRGPFRLITFKPTRHVLPKHQKPMEEIILHSSIVATD